MVRQHSTLHSCTLVNGWLCKADELRGICVPLMAQPFNCKCFVPSESNICIQVLAERTLWNNISLARRARSHLNPTVNHFIHLNTWPHSVTWEWMKSHLLAHNHVKPPYTVSLFSLRQCCGASLTLGLCHSSVVSIYLRSGNTTVTLNLSTVFPHQANIAQFFSRVILILSVCHLVWKVELFSTHKCVLGYRRPKNSEITYRMSECGLLRLFTFSNIILLFFFANTPLIMEPEKIHPLWNPAVHSLCTVC